MQARAEATRQRIVEAAAELMGVQGFQATCLDSVLERCCVSKGNFYHHFGSKEELGLAVLDYLGAAMQARFRERMEQHTDPLRQIESMMDTLVEAQDERDCRGGCPLGNLAAEMSDVHEGFRARLATVLREWQGLVAGALEKAATDRGRRDLDVDGLARYVVCTLEGSVLVAKVSREIGDLANAVANLKTFVRQQVTG